MEPLDKTLRLEKEGELVYVDEPLPSGSLPLPILATPLTECHIIRSKRTKDIMYATKNPFFWVHLAKNPCGLFPPCDSILDCSRFNGSSRPVY